MRAQYHFRKSAKGQLLIWDVKKLVKKSQHLKVISIKVDQVKELNQCYWYELGEEKPTCDKEFVMSEALKLSSKSSSKDEDNQLYPSW